MSAAKKQAVHPPSSQAADARPASEREAVNHPAHYNAGAIEVISAIDDWRLGFYEGQVVKYVARATHKGAELEDLEKARWYLDRLIGRKGGAAWNPEGRR